MSKVLKFGAIVLGSLAGLLILAVIVAKLIPDETYKGWLTDAVTSATGRELRIDGPFELNLGFPLRVHAEGIAFANAEWGSQPNMYQADSLDVEVLLGPLLTGVIDLTVNHGAPQGLLETNAEGEGNWVLEKLAANSTEHDIEVEVETKQGSAISIIPRSIHLTDAMFEYRDGPSGRTDRFVVDDLSIRGEELSLDLQGSYNDAPTTLTARLGTLDSVLRGESSDVDVQLALGGIELAITGPIADLTAAGGPKLDLSTTLAVDSTKSFEPATQFELPDVGPIDAALRLTGAAGAYSLEDVSADLESEALTLNVAGTLGDLANIAGLDFALQAHSTTLAEVLSHLDIELPVPVPPEVHVTGTVIGSKDQPGVRDLNVQIKDEQIDVQLTGVAEDLLAHSGIDASLAVSVGSVAALSKYAGRELPDLGPVELSTRVVSGDGAVGAQDLSLDLNHDQLVASISGSVGDLLQVAGIDLSVEGHSGALADLIAGLGLEPPVPLPPTARISAHVLGSKDRLAIHDLDVGIDDEQVQINLSGAAEDIIAQSGIEADLAVSVESLAALSKYAGQELPTLGPIRLVARIESTDGQVAVSDLDLKLEDEHLNASVQGGIADLLNVAGIELNATVESSALSTIAEAAGIELPVPMPRSARVEATISGNKEQIAVNQLHASVTDDRVKLTADGSVANLLGPEGVDVTVGAAVESLAALSKFAGQDLPDLGPVNLSGHVISSGETYALDGLDVQFDDEALQARVSGAVRDLLAVTGLELDASVTVPSLAPFSALAGRELPDTGALALEARIDAAEGVEGPTSLSAKLSHDRITATVSGSVPDLRTVEGIDMEASIDAPSVAAVADLVGVDIPAEGPLRLKARVGSAEGVIRLEPFEVHVGSSDLGGTLTVKPSSELITVNGEFHSEHLNLRELVRRKDPGTETIEIVEGATKEQQEAMDEAEAIQEKLFSADSLETPLFPGLALDLSLTVQKLAGLQYVILNNKAHVKLDNGLLQVSPLHAEIGGRPLDLELRLDGSRSPVSLDVDLLVDSINVGDVVSEDTFLQGGTIDASIDINGQGESLAALMGGLNGEVAFAVQDSRIPDSILNSLGSGVLSTINPLKDRSGFTDLECAAINLQVTDGVAEAPEGFAMQTTQVTWLGKAEIDLNTEKIDVIFQPKPRKGLGIDLGGITRLVQVRGTLKKPRILLDPAGVAKSVAGYFAAVSTGGLSILVSGLIKKSQANVDVCEKILGGTEIEQ